MQGNVLGAGVGGGFGGNDGFAASMRRWEDDFDIVLEEKITI